MMKRNFVGMIAVLLMVAFAVPAMAQTPTAIDTAIARGILTNRAMIRELVRDFNELTGEVDEGRFNWIDRELEIENLGYSFDEAVKLSNRLQYHWSVVKKDTLGVVVRYKGRKVCPLRNRARRIMMALAAGKGAGYEALKNGGLKLVLDGKKFHPREGFPAPPAATSAGVAADSTAFDERVAAIVHGELNGALSTIANALAEMGGERLVTNVVVTEKGKVKDVYRATLLGNDTIRALRTIGR